MDKPDIGALEHSPPRIQRTARFLHGRRIALFIIGAGILLDCGLPTYRGVAGLYNANVTEDGMSIETAADAEPGFSPKH